MRIEYRDKRGRKVSSLADAIIPSIQDSVADRVRHIRCPVHGRTAQRVVTSKVGSQLRWNAEGLCCEVLRDSIARALS